MFICLRAFYCGTILIIIIIFNFMIVVKILFYAESEGNDYFSKQNTTAHR